MTLWSLEFYLLKTWTNLRPRSKEQKAKVTVLTDEMLQSLKSTASITTYKIPENELVLKGQVGCEPVLYITDKNGQHIKGNDFNDKTKWKYAYHASCKGGYLEAGILFKAGLLVISSRLGSVKFYPDGGTEAAFTSRFKPEGYYMGKSWVTSGRCNRVIDNKAYFITLESKVAEITISDKKKVDITERIVFEGENYIDLWPDQKHIYCLNESGILDIVNRRNCSRVKKVEITTLKTPPHGFGKFTAVEGNERWVVCVDCKNEGNMNNFWLFNKKGDFIDCLPPQEIDLLTGNTPVHRMAFTIIRKIDFLVASFLFKPLVLFAIGGQTETRIHFLCTSTNPSGCVSWSLQALHKRPREMVLGSELLEAVILKIAFN